MIEPVITCELHARFCQNMRSRRIELGMTQSQLADKIGWKQPVIAKLEKGLSVPGLDTVDTVANALGISGEGLLLMAPATIF